MSAQNPSDESDEAVRHVPEGKVYPCRRDDEGAAVREGFETVSAVICARSGIADSAERQPLVDYMHYAVVDAGSAGTAASGQFEPFPSVAEIIECKGFLA